MGYRFGGVHEGTVLRTFEDGKKGIPYGFIQDDKSGIGDLFFRNHNGSFGEGDRVVFRAEPGSPSPVAYGVMEENELNGLVLLGRL